MNNLWGIRRNILCNGLEDGLIIIDSNPEAVMSNDTEYTYRQNTDLYYYTGFDEPESVMVLEYVDGKIIYHLFVQPKNPSEEVWTGKRYGIEGAIEFFGADWAHSSADLTKVLENLLNKHQDNYLYLGHIRKHSKHWNYFDFKKMFGDKLVNIIPKCEEQRCKKSEEEIHAIRKSVELSAQAHKFAMMYTHPEMMEYELDGLIIYYLMKNGCRRLAYSNIVASGNNATTLHYDKNNSKMLDGDLVLIDAGGELNYYASDISRTWPVNGKFTQAQRDIYQLVLDAQKECISMVKPGITIIDIHKKSAELITSGLIKLGLLNGDVKQNIENETYRKFYMHGVGHWMGIDVHDCSTYDRKKNKIQPGNIFTVEPGIYISEDLDLPEGCEKYKGIGVRIEDDVLVTEDGYDVLSKDAPKEIDEIEAIVGTRKDNLFI